MNDVLQQALYIIVTGCATALTGLLCTFIQKKTKELTNDKYINGAVDAVSMAVSTVMQTYVDNIKKDGKFTQEAQEKAKEQAVEIATNLITVDAQKAITNLYGDFGTWICNKIEEEVKIQK